MAATVREAFENLVSKISSKAPAPAINLKRRIQRALNTAKVG